MVFILSILPLILGFLIVVLAIIKKLKPRKVAIKIGRNYRKFHNKEVRYNGQGNWN